MANASYKPGGGNVKIESQKVKIEAKSKVGARNDNYVKSGGDKKVFVLSTPSVDQVVILVDETRFLTILHHFSLSQIETVKLQWNAKSKIGSMNNATYKPGGGDKKIESRKLDFKDKAKSKVGSTANIKHAPGGGNVKVMQHDSLYEL
jgi:microtubule-associated protein tau